MREILTLSGTEITVGVQGTAATTAPGPSGPSEIVEIATVLHDGRFSPPAIPPRPFLSAAVKRHGATWIKAAQKIVRQFAAGDRDGATLTLRRLGVVLVRDVQGTMRQGPWAPNAPMTIARKGSDKPLFDTGQLVQSIRSEVSIPGRASEVIG